MENFTRTIAHTIILCTLSAFIIIGKTFGQAVPDIIDVKIDGQDIGFTESQKTYYVDVEMSLSETFTVYCKADKDGDDSPAGYNNITYSFPYFTSSSDIYNVDINTGGTSNDMEDNYLEAIHNMYGFYYPYLLVETSDDNGWDGDDGLYNENNEFTVDVSPDSYGNFIIYLRVAMSNQESWNNGWSYNPSWSNYTDMKGLYVYKIIVNIINSDLPPNAWRNSPTQQNVTVDLFGEQEFEVGATDENGDLDLVKWYLDNDLKATHDNYFNGYEDYDDWNYDFDEEGSFVVKAVVYDDNDNTDYVTWNVIVVDSDPTITRIEPSNSTVSTVLGTEYDFEAEVYEPDGKQDFDKVVWKANGSTFYTDTYDALWGNPHSSKTDYEFNSVGTTIIKATVYDKSGDHSSLEWNINVTDPPPTISFPLAVMYPEEDEDCGEQLLYDLDDYASDPNNPDDELTFTADAPDWMGITINSSNHKLYCNPWENQNGSAHVTVTVSDGNSDHSDWFELTIIPVNDEPAISNLPDVNKDEDANNALLFDLDTYAWDIDNPNSQLNFSHNAEAWLGVYIDPDSHKIYCNPEDNENGDDNITITVEDPYGETDSDVFKLTIDPVNDPPIASRVNPPQQTIYPTQGTVVSFTAHGLDIDPNLEYARWYYDGEELTEYFDDFYWYVLEPHDEKDSDMENFTLPDYGEHTVSCRMYDYGSDNQQNGNDELDEVSWTLQIERATQYASFNVWDHQMNSQNAAGINLKIYDEGWGPLLYDEVFTGGYSISWSEAPYGTLPTELYFEINGIEEYWGADQIIVDGQTTTYELERLAPFEVGGNHLPYETEDDAQYGGIYYSTTYPAQAGAPVFVPVTYTNYYSYGKPIKIKLYINEAGEYSNPVDVYSTTIPGSSTGTEIFEYEIPLSIQNNTILKVGVEILTEFSGEYILTDAENGWYDFKVQKELPIVEETNPENGETGIAITNNYIHVKFNKPMDESSVTDASNWNVFDGENYLSGTIEYYSSPNNYDAYFNCDQEFSYETEYSVTLSANIIDEIGFHLDGNGNGIEDGSPADDYSFSFTTMTLETTLPDENLEITQGETVEIGWNALAPPEYNVELYYDLDGIWDNGNETQLESNLPLSGNYNWNTISITPNTYHIVSKISGTDLYDYAPGSVIITGSYQITMELYKITNTDGDMHSDDPGNDRYDFIPGETVRITFEVTNNGTPAEITAVCNVRDANDDNWPYDSHTDGGDVDATLNIGETKYFSFDWQVPDGYEIFGDHDIGGSIRDQDNFESVLETTCVGPNSGWCADEWIIPNILSVLENSLYVEFISGPSGTINYNEITFTWEGHDNNGYIVGYEYKIDGLGFSTVNNYIIIPDQLPGNHIFEVRCIDNEGNYSAWIDRSYEISITGPVASPPYPIIFIHGWAGAQTSFAPWIDFVSENHYGWKDGGFIDVCLDAVNDSLMDKANDDVELKTTSIDNADFYIVNFDYNDNNQANPKNSYRISRINEEDNYIELHSKNQSDPNFINEDDILVVHNEFMRVQSIDGDIINVERAIFNSNRADHKGPLLYDNGIIKVYGRLYMRNISNLSNQSSIVKTGLGLKLAIDLVTETTKSSKVILVGHSMGGLTAREYVQSDLFDEENPDVAHIATYSTPHMGSNTSDIGAIGDLLGLKYAVRSESVRDLRYSLKEDLLPPTNPNNAPYLYGGLEKDPEWSSNFNFYGYDVNADGDEDDNIVGLNQKDWPERVSINAVIANHYELINNPPFPQIWIPLNTDDIVATSRQYPNTGIVEPGSLLETFTFRYYGYNLEGVKPPIHNNTHKNFPNVMIALDEPDSDNLAYELKKDITYTGFTTHQENNVEEDKDWYFFKSDVGGPANINIELPQILEEWNLYLYNGDETGVIGDPITTISNNDGINNIDFEAVYDQYYFFKFVSYADDEMISYTNPYKLKITVDYSSETQVVYNSELNHWKNINALLDIDFIDYSGIDFISYKLPELTDEWKPLTSDGNNSIVEFIGSQFTENWMISDDDWDDLNISYGNGGWHYIYFKVVDEAGNEYITPNQEEAFCFGKDLYPPSVYFSSPAEGQVIETQDPYLNWSISDVVLGLELSGVQNINYKLDDGEYTELEPGTGFVQAFGLEEGPHTAYLYATDNAGNTSETKEVNFTLNTSVNPPEPFSLIYPADDDNLTDQTPEFLWNETIDPDMTDITYELHYADNSTFDDAITETLETNSFEPTIPLEDNERWYWKVKAMDEDGDIRMSNELDWSFVINTQNDPPEAFQLQTPDNESTVSNYTPYFNWTNSDDPDPGDDITYELWIGTNPGFTSGTYEVYSTGSSHYTLNVPLSANTIYYWKVKAMDENGEETWSDETDWWFTTPNHAPLLSWTGETGFEDDGVNPDMGDPETDFEFRVTYTDEDGDEPLAGYPKAHLYFGIEEIEGSPFTMEALNGAPVNEGRIYGIDNLNLLPGTVYQYYFVAYDAQNDLAGGIANTTTSGPVVYDIVVLQPNGGELWYAGQEYEIQWDATGIFETIDLAYSYDNGSTWNAVVSGLEQTSSTYLWMVPDTPSTTCLVKATGNYATGSTEDVSDEIFEIHESISPPEAFSLIAPDQNVLNTLTPEFSWNPSSDPDGTDITYELWLAKNETFLNKMVFPDLTETSYIPEFNLDDNSTYYWKVKAIDGDGQETWSNELDWYFFINQGNNPPSAFALASPGDGDVINTLLPAFDWNSSTDLDPDDVITYTLYVSTNFAFTENLMEIDEIPQSDYTLTTPLIAGEYYYWKVKAVDSQGAETWCFGDYWNFTVSENAGQYAPELVWTGEPGYESDGLDPEIGNPDGDFVFKVKYMDGDGNPPKEGYPKLHFFNNAVLVDSYVMTEADQNDFVDGRIYEYTLTDLEVGGNYTYQFEAYDSNDVMAEGEGTEMKPGPDVQHILISDFYADETTILQGESIQFNDNSSGTPTSWSWEFEGGTPATSADPNPVVTYNALGVFDVTLTVANESQNDSNTEDEYIHVIEGQSPVADAGGPYEVTAGANGYAQITLNGTGSSDPDGTIVSWDWTWDGGSAGGETVDQEFPEGITTVTLTVTDNDGLTDSDQVDVTIEEYPLQEPIANAGGPYETVVLDGENAVTQLSGIGSDDPDGTIVSWEWTWDGGSTSGETVDQEFPVGITEVTLTVTDNDDLTDSEQTTVTVLVTPIANAGGPYEAVVSEGENAVIHLSGIASDDPDGTIVSWEWTWAGGNASGETVDQEFPAGITEITLTVTDNDDLTDSDQTTVTVLVKPIANAGGPYEAVVSEGENAEIELSGIASDDPDGTIISWEWTWDGGSASGETVNQEFPAGITEVTLTVTDNDELTDSDQTTVTLLVTPIANAGGPYEAVVSEGENAEILLDGSASYDPDGTIVSWEWTWDGGSASGETINQEFPAGITEVTLTVTDNDVLTDTEQTTVTVLVTPVANAGGPYEADANYDQVATILLDGSASYDPDGTIVSWEWTWDGESTGGETAEVEFSSGFYEVTLTVTDNDGNQHAAEATVTINEYIYTAPEITILYPEEGYLYEYTINSNGTATDVDDDLTEVLIRLNGNEWRQATGVENWTKELDLEIGENLIEAKAMDAKGLESDIIIVNVILSIQQITIPEGWSAISSYLNPNDPELEMMFQDIVGRNNLAFMLSKNCIYWPQQNINTLGSWDNTLGYKLKLYLDDLLEIKGPPVENKNLVLEPGINYVPVLSKQPVDIEEIFDNPWNDINYIFDISSNGVYWPEGEVFTLSELLPGLAYIGSFNNEVTIHFPEEQDKSNIQYKSTNYNFDNVKWIVQKSPDFHLIAIQNEALEGFNSGDMIGAFDSENNCVGAFRINETGKNQLLTVFGDDQTTEVKDGALSGESLMFIHYDANKNSEEYLTAVWDPSFVQHNGHFATNGTSGIINFKTESLGIPDKPASDESINIVPNPAHSAFYLNIKGDIITPVNVAIYNMKGQLIKQLNTSESSTKINIEILPKGVYMVNVKVNETSYTKRLVKE